MRSWIFQANPNRFDIDGFLVSQPMEFAWLVSRYGDEIKIGDRVFLWQAVAGGDENHSGIVAETRVVGPVRPQASDPHSAPYWRDGADRDAVVNRVMLSLEQVANKKERLRRSWLKDDPILRDLPIFRMAAATSFPVPDGMVDRLVVLWRKTGRDWEYAESLAGLYAYHRTLGGPVSQLPGSVVSDVALNIGRAVSGIYNKVLNFRALDPTDPRKGMDGGSQTDKRVWDEFFDHDARVLRRDAVEAAYHRLWPAGDGVIPADSAEVIGQNVVEEADKLTALGLPTLMDRYRQQEGKVARAPVAQVVQTRSFDRAPLVVAIAKERAGYRCEVPGCVGHRFTGAHGKPYCEVHHIVPLAQGGVDTIENVVCLCPNHHREAHHGANARALAATFREIRAMDGRHVEG
jgi:5-methylcytosine-specific restriction endonuclease McrA